MLVNAWVIMGGYAHYYKFVAYAKCLSSYAFTPPKKSFHLIDLTSLYRYAHSHTNTIYNTYIYPLKTKHLGYRTDNEAFVV